MTTTSPTTTAATPALTNGVDVPKLFETITAIKADPTLAACHFRAAGGWDDGAHNYVEIHPFHAAHADHPRPAHFHYDMDEPPVLLGHDQGPNPVEFAISALLGCMTTTMVYHAASRGITIESLESEVEGDIDLRGLLQLDPKVRSGYREIRVKFKVKSDADAALLKQLTMLSPVYDTLSNPVKVVVDVEKV